MFETFHSEQTYSEVSLYSVGLTPGENCRYNAVEPSYDCQLFFIFTS